MNHKEMKKKTQMNEILSEFNKTIYDLAEQISITCPNSIIAHHKNDVKNIIQTHPTKIMEMFIFYVLPDKDKIDEGDENYFINKSYSDIVSDELPFQKVFEIKNIWFDLTTDNQNSVIQYMQCLCYHAQEYFMIFSQ